MPSEDKDQTGDKVTLHAPDSSEESEAPPHCSLALTLSLSTSSAHNPPPHAGPLKGKTLQSRVVRSEPVHPASLISD